MLTRWLAVLGFALGLVASAHAGNVTCAIDFDLIPAQTYQVAGRVTLSNSYATNGETFSTNNTLPDVGACLCHSPARNPIVVVLEAVKGARIFEYDATNRKIIAYTAIGTQVTSTTDLSGVTLRWFALCS